MEHLTDTPIDFQELLIQAAAPARGGIASFIGLVRDHHRGRAVAGLAYSAYRPMAELVCGEIVGEAEARWAVTVVLRHRLGVLSIGDLAVAIVVAGDHREESFNACRYVIEELKRRVPIWKQESFADGSVAWVDPSAPTALPS